MPNVCCGFLHKENQRFDQTDVVSPDMSIQGFPLSAEDGGGAVGETSLSHDVRVREKARLATFIVRQAFREQHCRYLSYTVYNDYLHWSEKALMDSAIFVLTSSLNLF